MNSTFYYFFLALIFCPIAFTCVALFPFSSTIENCKVQMLRCTALAWPRLSELVLHSMFLESFFLMYLLWILCWNLIRLTHCCYKGHSLCIQLCFKIWIPCYFNFKKKEGTFYSNSSAFLCIYDILALLTWLATQD